MCMLHGVTLLHVLAMPTIGFLKSSSCKADGAQHRRGWAPGLRLRLISMLLECAIIFVWRVVTIVVPPLSKFLEGSSLPRKLLPEAERCILKLLLMESRLLL